MKMSEIQARGLYAGYLIASPASVLCWPVATGLRQAYAGLGVADATDG